MDVSDLEPGQLFRVSRAMFEQMIDAGVFGPDDKVQLLEGVLVQMSPQNDPHLLTIVRLNKLFVMRLRDRADVAPHGALRAGPYSRPEADLALWPPGQKRIPEHALLVIEVADSSLRLDRTIKAPIYAKAKVPEYWIVDVNGDCVERYTQPARGRYQQVETLHRGDRLALIAFPDLELAIDDVLLEPA